MSDLISMREYAELHGLPLETVKTRVKHNQIPVFRFGKSVLIDKNTPWEERKKTGRKSNSEKVKVDSRKPKLRIKITKAYYVAVEDISGKEVISDFTFLTREEARQLGESMKAKVESR